MVVDLPPQTLDVVQCDAVGETSVARAAEARQAGRPAQAAAIAQCVLERFPSDADAWFELGAARSTLGLRATARDAYFRALDLAPTNDDARLGIARLAWWDGDHASARYWLSSISPARSRDPDALELRRSLDAAEAHAVNWRADLSVAQSSLSLNLPDWTEARASLFHRDGSTGLGLGLAIEHARRFEREDLYVEGQATQKFGGAIWSIALGGASDADFRPQASVRVGAETATGPWQFAVTAARSDYDAGPVSKLDLRAVHSPGDAAQLFLQVGVVNDENGENRFGYGLGGRWRLPIGPTLDVGWSDGAESSEGFTVEVQAVTVGATFEVSDSVHIRAGLMHEMRDAYDRTEAALSLARTF
jgi:YaiO family outer membrane protein